MSFDIAADDWMSAGLEAPALWTDTPYIPGNSAGTVLDQSAPSSSGGTDWSGTFNSLFGNVTNYLIQRDAINRGLTQVRQPNGQVTYQRAGVTIPAPSSNEMGLLMIGGIVLLVVLLAKKG